MTTLLALLTLSFATITPSLAVPSASPTSEPISSATASALPIRASGGVTLATGKNFTGTTWCGTFTDETCVSLNGFAGNLLSFRPDTGTECFVMQGRCNAAIPYADLYHDSVDVGDLSVYPWIARVQSFICFEAEEGTEARGRVLKKIMVAGT